MNETRVCFSSLTCISWTSQAFSRIEIASVSLKNGRKVSSSAHPFLENSVHLRVFTVCLKCPLAVGKGDQLLFVPGVCVPGSEACVRTRAAGQPGPPRKAGQQDGGLDQRGAGLAQGPGRGVMGRRGGGERRCPRGWAVPCPVVFHSAPARSPLGCLTLEARGTRCLLLKAAFTSGLPDPWLGGFGPPCHVLAPPP